ncbi:hypothetical protein PV04_00189 [Phialophora macrospora]|uniref:FAD-binding FR-type domain-containing protein n=1 Tax=Phialophora macrospora TaxID=1851006 RepID=A0A0D2FU62_9EURO|nr:hypothetical protein PV04_00189 [Phialophora macrospora]
MMSTLRYLGPLLLVLASFASAAKPLGHQICVAACYNALNDIEFTDQPGGNGTSCLNDLRISSIYLCARARCEDDDIVPGVSWWQKQCKHSSEAVNVANYHSTTDNVSLESIRSLPTVEYKDKGVFDETAVPSNDAWSVIYGTLSAYSLQRHLHNTYRWIPYAFWALVFVIITGHRIFEAMTSRLHLRDAALEKGADTKAISHRSSATWRSVFHSHILLAPAFGRRLSRGFGWLTGGTRLPALTVLCYIIIHIAIMSVRYPTMERNIYYASRELQRLRYVSDRVGVLMSANLPFIWLFGTRNNFFLWATGLSFSTMQIFHRWVALVFAIEGIIHGSCFTAWYLLKSGAKGYQEELRDPLFVVGIVAVTAVWVMILLTWRPIRRSLYEFFKATHVLLSIVLLVAYHRHVVGLFQGNYLVFLWVCVGLWSFDYTSRILRVIIVNRPRRTEKGMSTLAHVTYNPMADMIRLTIPEARTPPVSPGTYYFISLPGSSWRIWEQHPFSAISIPEVSTSASASAVSVGPSPSLSPEQAKEATATSTTRPWRSPEPSAAYNSSGGSGITFLIRPKKGMTARLRNRLVASSVFSTTVHVLLEGPYGSHPLLFNPSTFSSIILIAGGSGITATLAYLHSIMEDSQRASAGPQATGAVATKRVNLVWIAREEELVRDVLRHELQAVLRAMNGPRATDRLRIELHLFATEKSPTKTQNLSSASPSPSPSPSASEKSSTLSLSSPVPHTLPKSTGLPVDIEKEIDVDTETGKYATSDTSRPQYNSTAEDGVPITFARPDVTRLISAFCTAGSSTLGVSESAAQAGAKGRIAVLACGPMKLAEEARHATRQQAGAGVRIKYFEEVYGW